MISLCFVVKAMLERYHLNKATAMQFYIIILPWPPTPCICPNASVPIPPPCNTTVRISSPPLFRNDPYYCLSVHDWVVTLSVMCCFLMLPGSGHKWVRIGAIAKDRGRPRGDVKRSGAGFLCSVSAREGESQKKIADSALQEPQAAIQCTPLNQSDFRKASYGRVE